METEIKMYYSDMSDNYSIDVRVDPKGRITIPKDIRAALGAAKGGRVTFIMENGDVRVVNAGLHTMALLQPLLCGAAEKAGLRDEQSVSDWVSARRKESQP